MKRKIKAYISISTSIFKIWFLKRRIPIFCEWEITYRCNLHCDFCTIPLQANNWRPEVTLPEAINIIDDLYKMGTRYINFSGGEPFLHKDFAEILKYTYEKGILTSVNTNASLINSKNEKILNYLNFLRVSLDGPKDIHNKLRNSKNSYDEVIRLIKTASKYRKKVVINTVVTSIHNKKNLSELLSEMANLDTNVTLSYLEETLSSTKSPSKKEMSELQNKLKTSTNSFIETTKELQKEHKNIVNSNLYLNVLEAGGLDTSSCKALDTTIAIKPDGSVSLPCNEFVHRPVKSLPSKVFFSELALDLRAKQGGFNYCKGCNSRCIIYPSALAKPKTLRKILNTIVKTI